MAAQPEHRHDWFFWRSFEERCNCGLTRPTDHDCMAHAVPYTSDGPLGHGWECGRCGAFLQAG